MGFKPSTNTIWIVSGSKIHWIYYTAVIIVWACGIEFENGLRYLVPLRRQNKNRISFSFSKYGVWHQQGVYRLCVTQNWVKFPMERAGTANSTNQTCALLEHRYHSGRETGGNQRKDGGGLMIKSMADGFATWSTAVNAGTEEGERHDLMAHSPKGL